MVSQQEQRRKARRAASDQRALKDQQRVRTAALARIVAARTTPNAYAVLASDHPPVFQVQCPHCADDHQHTPPTELVQTCPAQQKRYAVRVPLSQLPDYS